jgi:hypothetical protein
MWSSFHTVDLTEADEGWGPLDHDFNGPRTPSTDDNHQDLENEPHIPGYGDDHGDEAGSDEEYGVATERQGPKPKKGGYDSRIEQILYENPQLPILIVDAGKSNESGGKYIVYTIRTGVGAENGRMKHI